MKRNQDRSDIYIISLDTFMLLAVLGITLGILFLVVNPLLNPPIGIKIYPISFFTPDSNFNSLDIENNYLDIAGEINDSIYISEKLKNANNLYFKNERIGTTTLYQIRKEKTNYFTVKALITDAANDQRLIELRYRSGFKLYDKDKENINREMNYWKDLRILQEISENEK